MTKHKHKCKHKCKRPNYLSNKQYKKKLKDEREEFLLNFKNNIFENKDDLWFPEFDILFKNKNTDSCFDLKLHQDLDSNTYPSIDIPPIKAIQEEKRIAKIKKKNRFYKFTDDEDKDIKPCFKIPIWFNPYQQEILDSFFDAYIDMYNATLKYLKRQFVINKNYNIPAYRYLRTSILKNKRNKIARRYKKEIKVRVKVKGQTKIKNKNVIIKAHMLDGAIRLARANYKSADSNYKNGNMKNKKFRIRYWKKNKKTRIIDIEPINFNHNTIYKDDLGKVYVKNVEIDGKYFKLSDVYNKYKCECRLIHYREDNKYVLFVPHKVTPEESLKKHKRTLISIDLGIRSFLTGISDDEVLKIGTNIDNKIRTKLKKIDRLNEIIDAQVGVRTKKIKVLKKRIRIIKRKVKQMVDELHWKCINYLTKKYDNIIIGDFKVKGIMENKKKKKKKLKKNTKIPTKKEFELDKMTKRVASDLRFYVFKQRLEYKCKVRKVDCLKVDEKFTSKICSKCGNIDWKLGGNKIYKCKRCKLKIDRDVNASRNIYIKGKYMY